MIFDPSIKNRVLGETSFWGISGVLCVDFFYYVYFFSFFFVFFLELFLILFYFPFFLYVFFFVFFRGCFIFDLKVC